MEIRFISSLAPEDEARIAGGLATAIAALLDQLPIAYSLRIDTAVGKKFQHTHYPDADGQADTGSSAQAVLLPFSLPEHARMAR